MGRIIKHLIYEVSNRANLIIAVLLLFAFVGFIWLLFTINSQSQTQVTIAIAAISAFFASVSSVASMMQAREAQLQRENQERPYIVVFFDASGRGGVYFEILNAGNSPAVNLTLKFNPQPIDFLGRNLGNVSLFQKPISFMPQGKVYRQLVDVGYKLLANGKPTKFQVSLSYSSVDGRLFTESTDFDLEYLREAGLPNKSTEEILEDICKELKDLKQNFKSVTGLNSILIESPVEGRNRSRAYWNNRMGIPHWKTALLNSLERITTFLER